jgi:hypothetical protein
MVCAFAFINPALAAPAVNNASFAGQSAPHPQAAWDGLTAALNRGDKATALTFFADPAKYDEIFTAIGDRIRDLPASLSGFTFIEIESTYATAVVDQRDDSGIVSQHYVSFVFHGGSWLIVDL